MKLVKLIDEHIEEWFLAVSLIAMVILTFTQIGMRFVFDSSLSWSEELVRYIFLWQVWIGVSYAAKKSKHLRIEMLPNKLSEKNRKKLTVVVDVIWILFCLFMVKESLNVVLRVHKTGQLSAALQMPMWIPYASVTVGFTLMSIRLIQEIMATVKPLKQGGAET